MTCGPFCLRGLKQTQDSNSLGDKAYEAHGKDSTKKVNASVKLDEMPLVFVERLQELLQVLCTY